jgi:seryl-tRNA synthetase
MHDIKWIREHPDAFDRALARRGLPGEARSLLEIDNRRRAAIQIADLCWRAAMRSHARLGQRRKQ